MRRGSCKNVMVCTLAALVAGGCGGGSYVRRAPLAAAGAKNQGGSWELVMPGGQETRASLEAGAEDFRRDWILASQEPSDLPADAWPEPYRPGLERTRRLFISNQPDEFLYIGTEWWSPAYRCAYPWWR
jgi:hypothetical protein